MSAAPPRPSPRTQTLGAALVVVAAGSAWHLFREHRAGDDADALREVAALHAARDAVLRGGAASLAETYAAALPDTAALQELLIAAGVPRFLPVADLAAARALPSPGPRLVLAGAMGPEARALCGPDRVVISVQPGAPTRAARAIRVGDVTAPLAGAPAVDLAPAPGEVALAADEAGAPLALASSCEGGVALRLGVDLGGALLRLRQGDPARRDRDHDANGEVQPADLLPTARDGTATRPWADELVDALLALLDARAGCPLPRTATLPAGDGAVVVITADQDYASDDTVRAMAERLAARGARATFLLTDPRRGLPADLNARGGAPELSDGLSRALRAAGHGLGIHPFPARVDDVGDVARAFAARRGARPLVARNHHLRWSGHLETVAIEAREGVAMNLDWMPVNRGGAPSVGFPGGSARPLRFVGDDRRAMPILQQPTVVDDFSLRVPDYPQLAAAAEALGRAAGAAAARSRREGFAVVVNAHPVFARFAPQWLDPLLDAPGARVITAESWLGFQLARRAARIPAGRCRDAVAPTLPAGVTLRAQGAPRTSQ